MSMFENPLAQSQTPSVVVHPVRTSLTHPLQVSWIIPDETLLSEPTALFTPGHDLLDYLARASTDNSWHLSSNTTKPLEVCIPSIESGLIEGTLIASVSLDVTSTAITNATTVLVTETNTESLATSTVKVNIRRGNVCLSSCPGKKVRLLQQDTRGRPSIRRELLHDFQRIKSLGVSILVCCLDDQEMNHLGAPWEKYSHMATEMGLEIIRIPIVEGLAPLDIHTFHHNIVLEIEKRVARGQSVLIHCRGGIGRAALVVCSWMLHVGYVFPSSSFAQTQDIVPYRYMANALASLLGRPLNSYHHNDDDSYTNQLQQNKNEHTHTQETTCDSKTATYLASAVGRVIFVARHCRSPKAIETPQQERFLAQYLLYLHNAR